MNPLMKPEMMEATRLTREGRLNEAVSVLIGSSGSSRFEATAPRSAPGPDPTQIHVAPTPAARWSASFSEGRRAKGVERRAPGAGYKG
jgi:hypothetical protein